MDLYTVSQKTCHLQSPDFYAYLRQMLTDFKTSFTDIGLHSLEVCSASEVIRHAGAI